MNPTRLAVLATALACALLAPLAPARAQAPLHPKLRSVYLDRQGVVRWRDDRSEVALFGANYTLPSASDYRAAGLVTSDRKRLIDEDMAQWARMGWDALRISFWGDWENSDRAGNLVANEHLDLADYLIAKARERGIYVLLTPITTYQAAWPDAVQQPEPQGFSKFFNRGDLGTKPEAIAAEVNYTRQILQHVNPYTGVAWKDEPAILFLELINEPWHHPEDLEGSVRYINALADAVRSTGCDKLLFYNVSQDFRIGEAIRKSQVPGLTFGWYPGGLNSGHELEGNFLRAVDAYPDMLRPELRGMPRVVYEFDTPDQRTGYLYPAMARTYRAVGAQLAAMFAYDMLATASRNLGWQTHYLNLVYTPRKALSAVVAAEAMKRLPAYRQYGAYPGNTRFGDFRVSYEQDLGELAAPDAFLYTGTTSSAPPRPERLTRIAGAGSSPVVAYEGLGAYFLDRVRAGVWRLEVYPDALPLRDPFEPPSPDKVVTRAIFRSWPMRVRLPDLGSGFRILPITAGQATAQTASDGAFAVSPGVYVLSKGGLDRGTLPATLGPLRFDEFHAPQPDSLPWQADAEVAPQYLTGRSVEVRVRVADVVAPDSVVLVARPLGAGWFRRFPMKPAGGYDYTVAIPADTLRAGPQELAVTLVRGGRAATFPGGLSQRAWEWNFGGREFWHTTVVPPGTPLRLFDAADVPRLAFSRIGDAGRTGLFRVPVSALSGQPVFHLELPVFNGRSPADYTASLVVKDRVGARAGDVAGASGLTLRLRGVGPRQQLHVTLMETDGTSWSAALPLDSTWTERTVPLAEFRPGRGVLLPQGFPGEWNYWVGPAAGRGGAGDALESANIERIQFSLRPEPGVPLAPGAYGVEIESATLVFTRR